MIKLEDIQSAFNEKMQNPRHMPIVEAFCSIKKNDKHIDCVCCAQLIAPNHDYYIIKEACRKDKNSYWCTDFYDSSSLPSANDIADELTNVIVEGVRKYVIDDLESAKDFFVSGRNDLELALTLENYKRAWSVMKDFTNDKNEKFNLAPDVMVVPGELEQAARTVLSGINSVKLIVEPKLTSPTTWYLVHTNEAKPLVLSECGTTEVLYDVRHAWKSSKEFGVALVNWMCVIRCRSNV